MRQIVLNKWDKTPLKGRKWGSYPNYIPNSPDEINDAIANGYNTGNLIDQGMVLIDVDVTKGGKDTLLKALKELNINGSELPKPDTISAHGGAHYFIQYPEELQLNLKKKSGLTGIDIKMNGYGVAGGSKIKTDFNHILNIAKEKNDAHSLQCAIDRLKAAVNITVTRNPEHKLYPAVLRKLETVKYTIPMLRDKRIDANSQITLELEYKSTGYIRTDAENNVLIKLFEHLTLPNGLQHIPSNEPAKAHDVSVNTSNKQNTTYKHNYKWSPNRLSVKKIHRGKRNKNSDYEKVKHLLSFIDPDVTYDKWSDVCLSIRAISESKGDYGYIDILKDWSDKGQKANKKGQTVDYLLNYKGNEKFKDYMKTTGYPVLHYYAKQNPAYYASKRNEILNDYLYIKPIARLLNIKENKLYTTTAFDKKFCKSIPEDTVSGCYTWLGDDIKVIDKAVYDTNNKDMVIDGALNLAMAFIGSNWLISTLKITTATTLSKLQDMMSGKGYRPNMGTLKNILHLSGLKPNKRKVNGETKQVWVKENTTLDQIKALFDNTIKEKISYVKDVVLSMPSSVDVKDDTYTLITKRPMNTYDYNLAVLS